MFRRIIVRDAGLFVRAKESIEPSQSIPIISIVGLEEAWREASYVCPIREFISSGQLSLRELQRLWRGLKFGKEKIGPELIRNAIADATRHQEGNFASLNQKS